MTRIELRSTVSVCLTILVMAGVGLSLVALQAHGRGAPGVPAESPRDAQVSMSIQPTDSFVALGQTFTVAVVIEDAPEISGYDFKMAWNPSVFSVTAVVDAGFLGPGTLPIEPYINAQGELSFGTLLLPPLPPDLPSGDGALAVITLQATGVGTSTLDLYATAVYSRDRDRIPVPHAIGATAASLCDSVEIVDLAAESLVEHGPAVRFNALVTGAQPITYTWDLGDGSPHRTGVALPAITHFYPAPGTYTATLTVDNRCRTEDTDSVRVTVDEAGELPGIFLPLLLRQRGPAALGP